MARLTAPDASYHSSWLEGVAEFDGAHRDGGGGEDWPLEELGNLRSFSRFVDALIDEALPETPENPGTYLARTCGSWTATRSWARWPSGTS
ncbi:hypothetical protein [Arthrobacter sp. H16F315]|uniref:hypothetical protein n=1 Tax=Arthrobacter sp. H16F315 TaxID=2955314 RepID=UPI0020975612|nr:hypothetical protein [Arthrobacter sp. H16F315]MDD1477830.1 hypothetical protein [Arthrobacter sp. H16F315]